MELFLELLLDSRTEHVGFACCEAGLRREALLQQKLHPRVCLEVCLIERCTARGTKEKERQTVEQVSCRGARKGAGRDGAEGRGEVRPALLTGVACEPATSAIVEVERECMRPERR